ncbi:GntR family transcriptional regulator [Leucobacter ruminantium]|uniref:GntR family transcriptional regulator n=1 Tax=Leucobacter ruminantium TaxID=1289170 RepID=A0A939LXV1_9MICO|nr:GntR family transcriptional regulator [Leucobacter ruminantium]MBO1804928.1 GntR family transcriptional regulator [Leucobacter ruminantium]
MTPVHPEAPAPRTADDIAELFRGAIHSGQLGDGERLPTVRQTARDFGVAQATAAKAYRALEQEGLVVTRTAAGTRVAPGASRASGPVVEHARALAAAAQQTGMGFDDAAAVLRAVWASPPPAG